MSNNIILYHTNVWDSQAIEASTEEEFFPASNTTTRWKTQRWRSADVSSQYVRTTGGSGQQLDAIFMLHGNITVAADVRIKASIDNWVSFVYDEPLTRGDNGIYAKFFPTTLQYANWGVYVNDPGNTDGYISIGRVWYGQKYEPNYGFAMHGPPNLNIEAMSSRSSGGQVSTLELSDDFRSWNNLRFDAIDDYGSWKEYLLRAYKKAHFATISPHDHTSGPIPEPENNTHYVGLSKKSVGPVGGNYFSAVISLTEER